MLVTTERENHVVILTMRRADKLNAINAALTAAIVAGLDQAQESGARAIILQAEPGVPTWSAGHDISELPTDGQERLSWVNSLDVLLHRIRSMPVPMIAAVEGGVWGGACDLTMSVDLVVARQNATFAITPVKLGVPYAAASVANFVAALPVHIVNEMFFTADPIGCQRAYELGLVNRVVADSVELSAVSRELAHKIASRAPLAVRSIKAEIRAVIDASPMTQGVVERLIQGRNSAWASDDYYEGLRAFSERTPPNFTGH